MVYNILEYIASDNGKIFKEEELKKHGNNETLKRVISMAYNPTLQFYIRKIPAHTAATKSQITIDEALDLLENHSSRKVTGNAASDHLKLLLEKLDVNDGSIIQRVIGKDLKCGFSASTSNKAFGKGFIKETPYMGAISYNQKKVAKLFENGNEVTSDVKMDGRYTNVKITLSEVFMESRNGKETFFGGAFDSLIDIQQLFGFDVVLNGELVILGIDRYASNGIISSMVSIGNKQNEGKDVTKELVKFQKDNGKTYKEYVKEVSIVVWDYIPLDDYDGSATYAKKHKERVSILEGHVTTLNNPQLVMVETKTVKSPKEAMAHYIECVQAGEEGTILKSQNGTWKDGKPNWQIKFKPEDNHDLKIVGFNFGTAGTKNENVISSLNVETEDGLLKTSPGGINEKTMKFITENMDSLMGTIVEVKCSGLSQDSKGNYALLHPVFKRFRDDKNTAADLEKVIEVNNANTTI